MNNQSFELPPRQAIASAWSGHDLQSDSESWTINLSAAHITELKQAIGPIVAREGALVDITIDEFILPTLGPVLTDLQRELTHGRGFTLIKGLNVENYSEQEISTIFFGLGTHIGNARSQNAKGDILGNVKDVGAKGSDANVRIYQTSERQTFHTDSSDVVGLICLAQAQSGGQSMLVSASSIYNAFLERRPDLLPCLFDPIATDRRGEIPAGMKPFFEIPVFSWFEGQLTVMYQRQYIDSAQRFEGALQLTPAHVEALDLFDTLANDPDLMLSMKLEAGDMQFVHNHSMLHDRMGFVNWPEPERARHLLRLWLSVPGDRPLPACFAERFGTTEIGDRGGIVILG